MSTNKSGTLMALAGNCSPGRVSFREMDSTQLFLMHPWENFGVSCTADDGPTELSSQ